MSCKSVLQVGKTVFLFLDKNFNVFKACGYSEINIKKCTSSKYIQKSYNMPQSPSKTILVWIICKNNNILRYNIAVKQND